MEKKKVIYFGDIQKYFKVIEDLQDTFSWEYVLLINNNTLFSDSNLKNKSLDVESLENPKFIYDKNNSLPPLNLKILNSLSRFENIFLSILKDSSGWNFSFNERKNFYYHTLKYWKKILDNKKPDIIIFLTKPTTAISYALYIICKFYLKINVMISSPIFLYDKVFLTYSNSLEESNPLINKNYEENHNEISNNFSEKYIRNIKNEKNEKKKYFTNFILSNNRPFVSFLKNFFINKDKFSNLSISWKKNKKPHHLTSSRMNNLEYFIFLKKLNIRNKILYLFYENFCEKPNFQDKYIFLDLPLNNDESDYILQDVYEDTFLVLNILSSIIPRDWKIYFKENCFKSINKKPVFNGYIKKNKRYFKKISSYKNIKLISNNINTYSLIDNAQAVVSISGDTAWKSAIRGKGSLVFSNTWYSSCKGIFLINTAKEASSAIEKIIEGFSPKANDIQKYISLVKKFSIETEMQSNFEEGDESCKNLNIPKDILIKNIIKNYTEFYPRN